MQNTIINLILACFLLNTLNVPLLRAGEVVVTIMPKPGTMVSLSPAYVPAHLQGIVIHPDNALQFDFLINKGDGNLTEVQKKQEYNKLIKYFLASLTVPDKDQWVNLSPYEHNRIIQDDFGKTEMGRDLLGQDYLLKQIASTLMYPESELGKTFWGKVYANAYRELGNTNIPLNTFNKVWIVPEKAVIHEKDNVALIVSSHLKVMMEEDYLATQTNSQKVSLSPVAPGKVINPATSKVMSEIIIPVIEKEVNEGKNFAQLRQVFSGMILATWYKKALKESLLGKVYADRAKLQGINQDPGNNEAIYQEYLKAFKKGVFNYIKEAELTSFGTKIPRKYFAGGFAEHSQAMLSVVQADNAMFGKDFDNIPGLEAVRADVAAAKGEISNLAKDRIRLRIPPMDTGVNGTKKMRKLYDQAMSNTGGLERALELLERGFIEGAEVLFRRSGSEGNADFLKALPYFKSGEYARAIELFESGLAREPGAYSARLALGLSYSSVGQPERAIEQYRRAYQIDLHSFDPAYLYGEALYQQAQYADAERALRRAIQARSNVWQAHSFLGFALAKQDKEQEALAEFETSVRIQPTEEAWYAIAVIHANAGRTDETIHALLETIKFNPNHPQPYKLLGNKFHEKGELEQARKYYLLALPFTEGKADTLFSLAQIEFNLEQYQEANGHIAEYLLLEPRNADGLTTAGVIRYYLGDKDEAVRYLNDALRIEPGHELAAESLRAILERSQQTSPGPDDSEQGNSGQDHIDDRAMNASVQRLFSHFQERDKGGFAQTVTDALSSNSAAKINALYQAISNVDFYALQDADLIHLKEMLYQNQASRNVPEPWTYVDPMTGEKVLKVFADMEGTILNPDPKQKLNELIANRKREFAVKFAAVFNLKDLIGKPREQGGDYKGRISCQSQRSAW